MTNEVIQVADGVGIGDLDISLSGESLVVHVGEKHYRVGSIAKLILSALQRGGLTIADIRARLSEDYGVNCSEAAIEATVKQCRMRGMIHDPAAVAAVPEEELAHTPWWRRITLHSYLALKIPLVPAHAIAPVTRFFSPAFHPAAMATLMTVCLIAQFRLWSGPIHAMMHSLPLEGLAGSLAWILTGMYGITLLHEMGHGAACESVGVRHGELGFSVYILFPAFYTDVSHAWRLPRAKRMIVDAGGAYVTMLAATSLLTAYHLTGNIGLLVMSAICDAQLIVSILPILRSDGYWFMSDALGIPNLMASNKSMTWWLIGKLLRRPVSRPRVLDMPDRWRRVTYVAYYCVFIAALGSALAVFIVLYLKWGVVYLTQSLGDLNRQIVSGHASAITVLRGMQCLVILAGIAATVIYLERGIRYAASVLRRKRAASGTTPATAQA